MILLVYFWSSRNYSTNWSVQRSEWTVLVVLWMTNDKLGSWILVEWSEMIVTNIHWENWLQQGLVQALTSKSQQIGHTVPCSDWLWFGYVCCRRLELLLVLIALIVLIVLLRLLLNIGRQIVVILFLFDPFSTYEGCTWCLFYEVIAIHQMLVDFWKWFLFDKMLFVIELCDFQTCDWIFWNLFVVNLCEFGWNDWFWNAWEVCKANHKRHFSFSFCWKLEVGVRFATCLLELFSVGEVLLVDCTFVLFLVVCWLRAELFITVHIWTRINSKENCLLCWSTPITNMSPQEVDCIHQPSHTWHSLKQWSQETFWVPTVAPFAEKWEVVLTKNGRLRTRPLTFALPSASHLNWVRWVGRYCWG